jgi:hypothetical protein
MFMLPNGQDYNQQDSTDRLYLLWISHLRQHLHHNNNTIYITTASVIRKKTFTAL